MIRKIAVALAVVGATVAVGAPAHAAACASNTASTVAIIAGANGGNDDLYVRQNTDTGEIECRSGSSGGYTAVAIATAVNRVDIDTGAQNDTVHLGDATYPASTMDPTINVDMGFDDDTLVVDESTNSADRSTQLFDGVLVGLGFGSILFDNIETIEIDNGTGSDSDHVALPIPFLETVIVDGGNDAETNQMTVTGSEAGEVFTLEPNLAPTVRYQDTVVGLLNMDALSVFGHEGNDKIIATSGWPAIPLKLYGDDGKDKLVGGPAPDLLEGGPGRDSCNGKGGKDTLHSC